LTALDLTDPLAPAVGWTLPIPGNAPIDIEPVDEGHYVAAGGAGLVWLPDPLTSNTRPAAVLRNFDHVKQCVFYPPHYLLLADNFDGGLQVLDIRQPARPRPVHVFQLSGFCESLEAFDGFVVLGVRTRGLMVVNLEDPARPWLAAHFQSSQISAVKCIARWGRDRLLVGYQSGVVDVFDFSDLERPLWLGRIPMGAEVNCLAVRGDLMIAGLRRRPGADPGRPQLQIMRLVTNPAPPEPAG
jgi:hypothetical protein